MEPLPLKEAAHPSTPLRQDSAGGPAIVELRTLAWGRDVQGECEGRNSLRKLATSSTESPGIGTSRTLSVPQIAIKLA